MQRTENYRLFKPESTDNGSPEPFNNNADVVDAELNRLSTGLTRVDNALVAAQDVLESGITAAKVSKLDALPTSTQLDGSLSSKANKSDITNISITGTTNNTGSTILAGTLFYLNGTLCKALTNIASGETFSENSNYVTVTIANALPKVIGDHVYIQTSTTLSKICSFNYPRGWKIITIQAQYLESEPQEMFLARVTDNFPMLGNTQKLSTAGFAQGSLTVTVVTNVTDIDVWAKYSVSGQNRIDSTCVMLMQ